jgi:hypothetical protein
MKQTVTVIMGVDVQRDINLYVDLKTEGQKCWNEKAFGWCILEIDCYTVKGLDKKMSRCLMIFELGDHECCS